MADISKISQNILNNIKNVEMQDGKKGITSAEERNALAQMLSNGEVTGGYNQEYVQNLIDNYDLKEAENNASKDVRNITKQAMKDGELDDHEVAILDQIIDNTMGKYSAEDIELAKMTKKTMGLSTDTPFSEAQKENAQRKEQYAQLETRNENLRDVVSKYQEKVNELINRMNELQTALDAKEKELESTDTKTKTEIEQLKKQMKAISDVLLRRLSNPSKDFVKHFEDSKKDADNSIRKASALVGAVGAQGITKDIANSGSALSKSVFD